MFLCFMPHRGHPWRARGLRDRSTHHDDARGDRRWNPWGTRLRTRPAWNVPIPTPSKSTRKYNQHKYLSVSHKFYKNRSKRIKTSVLNEVLLPLIEKNPPPAYKGKYVKIKYIMQLPTPQPQFAFFCNLPQYVKEPYKRFLENKLREHFNFHGL